MTRSEPEMKGHDELIDFRAVTSLEIPNDAIAELAACSRAFDNPEYTARSALIASSALISRLSPVFWSRHAPEPDDHPELRVFEKCDDAVSWLETTLYETGNSLAQRL